MQAGIVKWHHYFERKPDGDPLYDLNAVANLNEILIVNYENERRAYKSAETPPPK